MRGGRRESLVFTTAIDLVSLLLYAQFILSPVAAKEQVESPHAAVVDWDFSAWCQVGKHRFILERTTLNNIVQDFGRGKIERSGDAGAAEYEWFVSYRWNRRIVTFSSNSDMGGSDHKSEKIDIKPTSNGFAGPELPIIKGPVCFPIGNFEMTYQELRALLGTSPLVNGYAEYQYPGHIEAKDDNGNRIRGDVSGWLRVKIVKAKVDQIEISRITTY